MIELTGSGTDGFSLSDHTGSTIAGFAIGGFTNGVNISGGGSHQILGNYIGIEVDGVTIAANSNSGVLVSNSDNNVIGAVGDTNRNVIAGGGLYGINLDVDSDGTIIQNNAIGTSADGTVDLGASLAGILVHGNGTLIGTDGDGNDDALEGNLIAGNRTNVDLFGDNNTVAGNTIGLASMTQRSGVVIEAGSSDNTIGGTAVDTANIFNSHSYRAIDVNAGATTAGRFLQNTFFGNAVTNIDLGSDGVTANDGDFGSGANQGMDSPTITVANLTGSSLELDGFVGLAAGDTDFANARVEFFRSVGANATAFLGFLTTDANGLFSGTLTVSGLTISDNIFGTATSNSGYTSEFGVDPRRQRARRDCQQYREHRCRGLDRDRHHHRDAFVDRCG